MASDTIFALATPPGKSGVAVLRISGKGALPTLQQLTGKREWTPNKLTYSPLTTQHSALIDHGMAVYFKAPKSFTGEEVVELHIHGSLAVIRELLGILESLPGLRPAERGEFTRRALLNGKMDLLEVEGLADLIDAETSEQKSQALRQLQGELSGFYERLRKEIIATLAHLEAYIDFPDEEIPESVLLGMDKEVRAVMQTIAATLEKHADGERIRNGISIVILGAPNSGKSSLINALSKREAAIVSHHAGTTRDLIEVHMEIAGYPVILVDTAGIRESDNDIEAEGIRRAIARAEHADIRLVLFDGTQAPDAASLRLLGEGAIAVSTKSDLKKGGQGLAISTQTGEGISELLTLLETRIVESFSGEGALITRSRHRGLLQQASRHLEAFFEPAELELKCEELRLAAGSIAKITGKIAVDDVLDVVFREFCIGK
ncbi:MAG: tRNA uridine-5-carboxymethylaminomethyl(34) synthesis GTPase MnmE [Alphaproteobacteria bacterium]|nr:tRNA uridine-5-carboxymethylaminomethyl(34) synthesis GTPase MnmE [Alphaproteobacteria bacterium]